MKRSIAVAAVLLGAGGLPGNAQESPPLLPPSGVLERLGHPPDTRLLIIQGDGLGETRSANRATFRALEAGWLNTTTLSVPGYASDEAVEWLRRHPEVDAGVHLFLNSDLGEPRSPVAPVASVPSLVDAAGHFYQSRIDLWRHADTADLRVELRAQIEKALASGVRPTHLDVHRGALWDNPRALRTYLSVAEEYRLPPLFPRGYLLSQNPEIRALAEEWDRRGLLLIDRVRTMYPGAAEYKDWRTHYENLLKPLHPGIYLLIVHVADNDEEILRVMGDRTAPFGGIWHESDERVISDPRFRLFLAEQGFKLTDWREVTSVLTKDAWDQSPKRPEH